MKRVLFFRDYTVHSGGHLKLWDYFQHVLATPGFDARISFTANSKWDASNPWNACKDLVLGPDEPWEEFQPDILFLEGTDWPRLPAEWRDSPPVPVYNLIQHVRHADPANERYAFLKHPAIRICVSQDIQFALDKVGFVYGPTFVNPNGIDLDNLPTSLENRPVDVLIGALKNPEFGHQLSRRLEKLHVQRFGLFPAKFPDLRILVLDKPLLRDEYLRTLGQAKIAVFIPTHTEGFYLPALEAMALQTLVVCPDVVGNRSFCLHGKNCFRPSFKLNALAGAVERMLRLSSNEANQFKTAALETASEHSLTREREIFQDWLLRTDTFWSMLFDRFAPPAHAK